MSFVGANIETRCVHVRRAKQHGVPALIGCEGWLRVRAFGRLCIAAASGDRLPAAAVTACTCTSSYHLCRSTDGDRQQVQVISVDDTVVLK
jgi:hypothetical protein